MPELPEVEICARSLRRWIPGRTVLRAKAKAGLPLRDLGPKRFSSGLEGRTIERVRRTGKQLFIDLSGDHVLLVHLGMTGKFLRDEPRSKATRFTLGLDDGHEVLFQDPRRFGRIRLLGKKEAKSHPEIARLGPDALRLLRRDGLRAALEKAKGPIKPVLMDQSRLAGIGNIHAAEALFLARISPSRSASSLAPREWNRLTQGLLETLERTLDKEKGRTVRYLGEVGAENHFWVYGREGEPCPRCSHALYRFMQASRSTYCCPSCQDHPVQ